MFSGWDQDLSLLTAQVDLHRGCKAIHPRITLPQIYLRFAEIHSDHASPTGLWSWRQHNVCSIAGGLRSFLADLARPCWPGNGNPVLNLRAACRPRGSHADDPPYSCATIVPGNDRVGGDGQGERYTVENVVNVLSYVRASTPLRR